MIRLLGQVPKEVYVAVSGGADSMAALDFLVKGKRSVHALHFDHGTPHGSDARKFVVDYCSAAGIPLTVSTITREKLPGESMEEFWRNERIRFFREHSNAPVVTAHHLDDAVEWWIFTSLNGNPTLMRGANPSSNVIRPFLMVPKETLVSWCTRKDVPFVHDPSNESRNHNRNRIRHDIIPHALLVNPGLRTVIRKKIADAHTTVQETQCS
jgi:tRNA(Ile)-lysidine synthase TilS/MesJ